MVRGLWGSERRGEGCRWLIWRWRSRQRKGVEWRRRVEIFRDEIYLPIGNRRRGNGDRGAGDEDRRSWIGGDGEDRRKEIRKSLGLIGEEMDCSRQDPWSNGKLIGSGIHRRDDRGDLV